MKNGLFEWGVGAAAAVLLGTGLVYAGASARTVQATPAGDPPDPREMIASYTSAGNVGGNIAEWFRIAAGCTITSGKDNEVGAVRSVGAEILVAKTEFSYAYTQPVREGRPYNLYHGNLEARAIDANTTKLLYTLVYDLSLVPGDDAAKAADVERRRVAFTGALANMKILAEGGTLPPR